MSYFEECMRYSDEILQEYKKRGENISVEVTPETKYLMCQEYMRGYLDGKSDGFKAFMKIREED